MRNSKFIYYWDACIFIAWLQDEQRPSGEMEGLAAVVNQISRNEAAMLTSVLTRAEVLDSSLSESTRKIFENIFKRSNIYQVDVTGKISEVAHEIRDFYKKLGRSVKTPDATHLATAIIHSADEFHTFDDKLLGLSGDVAGYPLKVVRPQGVQGSLLLGQFR